MGLSCVERRDRSACRRRRAWRDRRHRRHGGGHGLRPRGDRAHHRRAQKHRLRGLRRFHRLAAHVRNDLADQWAARRAAADDDRIEFITRLFELADDVGQAIGEAAEASHIEFLQARGVFPQIHPHHGPARARIRRRRSAADEVRQDVQALGDQRRLRQAAGPGDDLFLERVERVRPGARRQFSKGRMQPQQMIDRSAERRLPAVDKPLIRGQRAEMRPPDPVHESGPVGKRHAARRRAQNQSQTPARIGLHAARSRPQRARGAGVRVDQPGADRRPGPQGPSPRRPRPSVPARAARQAKPSRRRCGRNCRP